MRKAISTFSAIFLVTAMGAAAAQPYPPPRPGYPPPDRYPQRQYQPRFDYGSDCRDENATSGAVLGAILGGLLGSQMGHGGGRTAATIGGIVLGGVAGSAIARDIDCRDRPYAFRAYAQGFDGPVGRDWGWQNDGRTAYGTFRPTREYHDRGYVCRDFQDDRYVRGRHYVQRGTACRETDGNWYLR